MVTRIQVIAASLCAAAVLALPASSAAQQQDATAVIGALEQQNEMLRHRLDTVSRQIDDLTFIMRLSDLASVDKIRITGPPRRYQPNPTAQGAGNPFIFWSFVFVPHELDRNAPQPLIVFPHGGVHSRFTSSYVNVLRELLQQGYTVVAPEYRGSTGYGGGTYRAIDYGGLETEDTWAARNFMLETYEFLDEHRVGIIGWSHGGLHALMNIFDHGDGYAAAYAGVPVSDLIARMGYKTQGYRELYSADYHIGKSAYEDVEEYKRRSPSWNTERYDGTPLLIHSTTNDQDVNVLEVQRLIQALQAGGKTGFEFKIYDDAPGAHAFNRLDTALARESRRDIWRFLASYLRPERPER